MLPRFAPSLAAASLSLVITTSALAQLHDTDIVPFEQDGRIHTGRVVDQSVTEDRVFGAEMTLFFGFPFTPDPGFNAPLDSFPPFSIMQLVLTDALRVWQDGAFDNLATYFPGGVETPLQMEVSFGATAVLSPVAPDTEATGIQFAVTSAGDLHVHPDHILEQNAPAGVYLLRFELRHSSAAIEDSAPFWLVYDWNADPAEHTSAIQWVRDNLVDGGNPADLNGDGAVNGVDLGLLLGAWGACPAQGACPADLNNDTVVNGVDLGLLLGAWGS
jgi:hypothetical protein